jgi:predicted site-specific integrase-resolvase
VKEYKKGGGTKFMTELQSAIDIAKEEQLSPQALYEEVRRGRLTPSFVTKGGRMLFNDEEVQRWKKDRAARKGKN